VNKEAQNFRAIAQAKEHHDKTCPWRGEGKRIYMTAFDIARMGWEEGDVIAGLALLSDANLTTGRFRVECDNEPSGENLEITKIVGKDLVSV
jgi:hypothetical protein